MPGFLPPWSALLLMRPHEGVKLIHMGAIKSTNSTFFFLISLQCQNVSYRIGHQCTAGSHSHRRHKAVYQCTNGIFTGEKVYKILNRKLSLPIGKCIIKYHQKRCDDKTYQEHCIGDTNCFLEKRISHTPFSFHLPEKVQCCLSESAV